MFNLGKAKKSPKVASRGDTYLALIDRTQATIEFDLDGTITTANQNFLAAIGYRLEEIVGKHHSIFVYQSYTRKPEYKKFWQDLANGQSYSDQFPRLKKDGSVIWLQATYAPCLDEDGKATSVIKIATVVTARRQGVKDIAEALNELSQGNLTHSVTLSDVPDIQLLGEAYNQAVARMSSVISAVKSVSQAVEHTANEIGQASFDLSRRTEQQAATLEETAAAIEQLTVTAKASADSAQEVQKYASSAMSTARNGGRVVEQAIRAMSEIEASSDRISHVIKIIDDISFQTNLLALNAGVEAARAGEAGRGFAVVASEVRTLAVRSSASASEIKALINDSSTHVSNGVALVSRTGEELELIITGIATIHDNISRIASAATEQSTALNEINTGVSHLDSMTQQNAAMVEQSTAASQMLAKDSSDLSRHVAAFQTAEHPASGWQDEAQNRNHQPHRVAS
ncbi:hypothetical protein P775_00465 [Puniceibacterium antarcticum]|uniref:Chemotaxis protein n=1 Tax=Puniceibacterium antarcticum TaxID=1206336 RepID=A0A2G8RKW2_9RHOB|nr:PAS domain-containing methyl-accepting chemotaxis protein [Puniceibacterium antarcticum]PIL22190.1 hypothetical protein P775_00465 [Puniceibacterium antarcticum]